MTTHCCEAMSRCLSVRCEQHDDPFACPDALIGFSAKFQEYADHPRRRYVQQDHRFLPWCGRRLPASRRDRWFDELERRGIDPWEDEVPAEFEDGRWLAALPRD